MATGVPRAFFRWSFSFERLVCSEYFGDSLSLVPAIPEGARWSLASRVLAFLAGEGILTPAACSWEEAGQVRYIAPKYEKEGR
jgi:hypothetical protein